MPKQIIWSPLSEKDFSSILEYLQNNWNNRITLKFLEITNKIIRQIALNPKQFPIIQKRKKIRKCVITKQNSIYYRERKDYIDILRIYDNRQDPRKLKFF
jgi:plasmid stabilization system protein ParE